MSFYLNSMNGYPYVLNIEYYSSFSYQLTSIQRTINDTYDYMFPVQYASQADYITNIQRQQAQNQNIFDKCQNIEYAAENIQNTKIGKKKNEKKSIQKSISSAKKNSQSNIVSQFYSFFSCRDKSQKIVTKAFKFTLLNNGNQQKIINLFYKIIREINKKRGRRYVNRVMLKNYFTPEDIQNNLPEFIKEINKVDYITLEELCQIFRRCCQVFIKIVSISAILTSKRITGISKKEHFKKRRKILKSLTDY